MHYDRSIRKQKASFGIRHKILHYLHPSGSLEIFDASLNLARLYDAAASPASRLRSAA